MGHHSVGMCKKNIYYNNNILFYIDIVVLFDEIENRRHRQTLIHSNTFIILSFKQVLMGVFFYTHSVALAEDLTLESHYSDLDSFYKDVNASYQQVTHLYY